LTQLAWAWEDENGERGHETEVEVNLETTQGGTRLVLLQRPFESGETRDRHGAGWSSSFARLPTAFPVQLGSLVIPIERETP